MIGIATGVAANWSKTKLTEVRNCHEMRLELFLFETRRTIIDNFLSSDYGYHRQQGLQHLLQVEALTDPTMLEFHLSSGLRFPGQVTISGTNRMASTEPQKKKYNLVPILRLM